MEKLITNKKVNQAQIEKEKFFYGWVIVAVSTLALVVSNGLSINGIPVFYKPMLASLIENGSVAADKAQSIVGTAAALTSLTAGIFSPVAGFLVQKFKARTMMIFGCLILGSGMALYSRAASPLTVYLSHFILGISLGFVGVLVNTVLVSNWFRRKRGAALGVVLTGTSIGGVLIPLAATPLILNFGWRAAMLAVSLIVWLLLLPVVIFLVKNRPSEIGGGTDGDAMTDETDAQRQANLTGLSLGEAVKTSRFWIFSLCAALIFYPIFATSQQFILYLQTDRVGLTPQQAGYAQAALFMTSIGGKFLFGFLSDRFPPTRVILICCTTMFLATLVLLSLNADNAFLFLIPFGLGYGGTFVLLQLMTAEYFGLKDFGKILGAIIVVETIGGAAGTVVTSRIADASGGDYSRAFFGVIITTGLALLLVIVLNFTVKPQEARF